MNYSLYHINMMDALNPIFGNLSEQSIKQSYPPYNIVSTGDDSGYIEIACAGFSKDQITIQTCEDKIMVTASKKKDEEDSTVKKTYIKRGLAKRDFETSFVMGKYIVVKKADLQDGVLTIELERQVPDEKKPKLITIG